MKQLKKVYIFVICLLLTLSLTGCFSFKSNPKTISGSTQKLKTEFISYKKSAETCVNMYCDKYLSYDSKPEISNVKALKKYLTAEYYTELIQQPFVEQKPQKDYIQQTSAEELYYYGDSLEINNSDRINDLKIVALCYQSIIQDHKTESSRIVYKFSVKKNDNKWIISSVEALNN